MLMGHGQLGTTWDYASDLLCLCFFLEIFFTIWGCVAYKCFHSWGCNGFCSFGSGRSVGLRGMRIPDTSITKKVLFLYSLLVSSVVEPSLDSSHSIYHSSSIAIILYTQKQTLSALMFQIANVQLIG